MARHKDYNWSLGEGRKVDKTSYYDWDTIKVSLLMDIRDELKALNALLSCQRFLNIPNTLDAIYSNTRKPNRKHDQTRKSSRARLPKNGA